MNRLLVVCLASVAFSTLGAAARAQGLDSAEVEAYPQALAMRPLVLGSGHFPAPSVRSSSIRALSFNFIQK